MTLQMGGGDPKIHHVDPERDKDHYPRVVPGKMRGEWAACGDCRGSVKAVWEPGPHLKVVED